MANKNKEAMQELVKGISYLIDNKYVNSATQVYTGVITNVDYGESTYTVKINDNIYTNVPTITDRLTPNKSVVVVIPQGQYNQMFIMGYIH